MGLKPFVLSSEVPIKWNRVFDSNATVKTKVYNFQTIFDFEDVFNIKYYFPTKGENHGT